MELDKGKGKAKDVDADVARDEGKVEMVMEDSERDAEGLSDDPSW